MMTKMAAVIEPIKWEVPVHSPSTRNPEAKRRPENLSSHLFTFNFLHQRDRQSQFLSANIQSITISSPFVTVIGYLTAVSAV